jgi:hypothetical protein
MTQEIIKERIEILRKLVGQEWIDKLYEDELHHFIVWASEGQVYFYPGNDVNTGDAFRGFCMGCTWNEDAIL